MSCRRKRDPDHPYPTDTPVTLYSSLGLRIDDRTVGLIVSDVRNARMAAQHHFEQWGDRAEIVNARGTVLFRAGRRHDYDAMFARKCASEDER